MVNTMRPPPLPPSSPLSWCAYKCVFLCTYVLCAWQCLFFSLQNRYQKFETNNSKQLNVLTWDKDTKIITFYFIYYFIIVWLLLSACWEKPDKIFINNLFFFFPALCFFRTIKAEEKLVWIIYKIISSMRLGLDIVKW